MAIKELEFRTSSLPGSFQIGEATSKPSKPDIGQEPHTSTGPSFTPIDRILVARLELSVRRSMLQHFEDSGVDFRRVFRPDVFTKIAKRLIAISQGHDDFRLSASATEDQAVILLVDNPERTKRLEIEMQPHCKDLIVARVTREKVESRETSLEDLDLTTDESWLYSKQI